jgi:hypothetical protein
MPPERGFLLANQFITAILCSILVMVFTTGTLTNNWTGLEKLIEFFKVFFPAIMISKFFFSG